MKLYVTFEGIKDLEPDKYEEYSGNLQMVWNDVRNDAGELLIGRFYCSRAALPSLQLRSGNRYVLECNDILGNKILNPKSIKHTYKNPKCGLIRKVGEDYTFIKGKFKDKWLSKLNPNEQGEMSGYLLYLADNTNNEATVINVLEMLKKLNDE